MPNLDTWVGLNTNIEILIWLALSIKLAEVGLVIRYFYRSVEPNVKIFRYNYKELKLCQALHLIFLHNQIKRNPDIDLILGNPLFQCLNSAWFYWKAGIMRSFNNIILALFLSLKSCVCLKYDRLWVWVVILSVIQLICTYKNIWSIERW